MCLRHSVHTAMCRFRPSETVAGLGVHAGPFQELRPLQQSPYVTVQQCQLVASVNPLLSTSFDLIIRYSKLTHCLLSSVSCASPGPEMAPESGSAFACASPHAPARPAQEFGCDSRQPGLNGSPDAASIRVPNIAPLIQELALGRETKCNKTTKRKNLST